MEDVESFRRRAREWLAGNMPLDGEGDVDLHDGGARRARDRELQRRLWDGRFAGICFPAEYGGLGLTVEHQRAFTEESLPYQMPISLNVPTLSILAATLLDFGTEEQKRRHIPAILRGEELWVQFLSEPTGGSDLAGCITRADRDGDVWILNGSKIWSSGAIWSDYAMCLARTNWEVPKHRGLSMFIVKIHQPGIHVEQIRQVDGSLEFCQEFFDDVPIPAENVIGQVDEGWTVASRLLLYERAAVGGASPYTSGRTVGAETGGADRSLVQMARELGRQDDPRVRQLAAEAHVLQTVAGQLGRRVSAGVGSGRLPAAMGSVLKLFGATLAMRRTEIGVEIGGADAVAWPPGTASQAARYGRAYPSRQEMALGGGSNEMQRNLISERVLGMPREWAADRDVPFREVQRNTMPRPPR